MRSPDDRTDSGHSRGPKASFQDTLDAFEPVVPDDPVAPEVGMVAPDGHPPPPTYLDPDLRQESIDNFMRSGPGRSSKGPPSTGSRAMEGLALEMEIERVALTEAESGISRDELVLVVAREVKVPLEDLDLVDGYLTDLELEGLVRRVGGLIVLPHHDDGDLLEMDLSEREFLSRYRRRYLATEGGGGG